MKRLLLGSLLSCMVVSQVSCGIWDSVVKPNAKGAAIALATTYIAGKTFKILTDNVIMGPIGSFCGSAAVALASIGIATKSLFDVHTAKTEPETNEAKKKLFTSTGALITSSFMIISGLVWCVPLITESHHIHTTHSFEISSIWK